MAEKYYTEVLYIVPQCNGMLLYTMVSSACKVLLWFSLVKLLSSPRLEP